MIILFPSRSLRKPLMLCNISQLFCSDPLFHRGFVVRMFNPSNVKCIPEAEKVKY